MQDDPTPKTEPLTSWRDALAHEPPFKDLFLDWEEGETYFLDLARLAANEPRGAAETLYDVMGRTLYDLAFATEFLGTDDRARARTFVLELTHRTRVALIPALAGLALPNALARAAIAARRFGGLP
jgi:hypothetical protein